MTLGLNVLMAGLFLLQAAAPADSGFPLTGQEGIWALFITQIFIIIGQALKMHYDWKREERRHQWEQRQRDKEASERKMLSAKVDANAEITIAAAEETAKLAAATTPVRPPLPGEESEIGKRMWSLLDHYRERTGELRAAAEEADREDDSGEPRT